MEKVKPSLLWLLVVPVLMIGGVVGAITMVAVGGLSILDSMQRVPAGQTGTVTFESAGPAVIFIEQRGVMEPSIPAGLKLTITPEAGGEPLSHSYSVTTSTYNVNGVAGRSWMSVNVPAPGRYTVATTYEDAPATVDSTIAITNDATGSMTTMLVGGLGFGGGGFVLGLVALIWILVARSRSQKRIMQARYAQMPPMPPPGYANH